MDILLACVGGSIDWQASSQKGVASEDKGKALLTCSLLDTST